MGVDTLLPMLQPAITLINVHQHLWVSRCALDASVLAHCCAIACEDVICDDILHDEVDNFSQLVADIIVMLSDRGLDFTVVF